MHRLELPDHRSHRKRHNSDRPVTVHDHQTKALERSMCRMIRRTKRHWFAGTTWNLESADLVELWRHQQGMCAYSGLKLQGCGNRAVALLPKLPRLGFIRTNTLFVCHKWAVLQHRVHERTPELYRVTLKAPDSIVPTDLLYHSIIDAYYQYLIRSKHSFLPWKIEIHLNYRLKLSIYFSCPLEVRGQFIRYLEFLSLTFDGDRLHASCRLNRYTIQPETNQPLVYSLLDPSTDIIEAIHALALSAFQTWCDYHFVK